MIHEKMAIANRGTERRLAALTGSTLPAVLGPWRREEGAPASVLVLIALTTDVTVSTGVCKRD